MVSPVPTSEDIIALVEAWTATLGVDEAFKIAGKLLVYSGPRASITKALPASSRNHKRTAARIRTKKYGILDQTVVAQRVNSLKGSAHIYDYFSKYYARTKDATGEYLYIKHANAVMEFISDRLMQAAKGDVETLVCGADFTGVYYRIELPALMKNPAVTSINGVAIDRLRSIFFSGDADSHYQTFRKICQSELALARSRAAGERSVKRKAALGEEYQMSRAFFVMERAQTVAVISLVKASATAPALPAPTAISHHRARNHADGAPILTKVLKSPGLLARRVPSN